jgi:tetratricopeptide (TPR) repeat protein
MEKVGRMRMWFFLIVLFLFQLTAQAQSKKYFVITGKIGPESAEAGNGTIEITRDGKEMKIVEIPKNLRFRLELEFFSEYSLNFKYPGHFNKIINVSTEIPQEVWARDNDFPVFPMVVTLLKEFEGIDKSFTLKPAGRIFYGKEIDNFEKEAYISDIQFLEQIETAKTQANQVKKEAEAISKVDAQDLAAKQKDFDLLVKEADTHYQRGEYQLALVKYLEARKLFPDKAYPNDRVAELQDLVKALENTEKQKADLEQKYNAAIAKANGFFDQKSYISARSVYEDAIHYKPGDVFASGRIKDIDQLLALLEKQKKYNETIAQADNNFKSKNYDQAIALYNQASQLIPEDQYPKNQIALINTTRQQQAQLEQTEKEFNQALATANTQAQQKEYLQAIQSYKKALGLKPDHQLAKDKLAEAEHALIAIETDKKYQQVILLADQAWAANDLPKAKINYQEALKIKSAETYPKDKLTEIAESEGKEARFNELVSNAEKAFSATNYDESLKLFAQALELKPKNATVQKRIDDIQVIRQKQLTDKEYTDLITQADQSFLKDELDAALAAYNKAILIHKSEAYPKDQIKKIGTYQDLVRKANKLFDSADLTGSLSAFTEALAIKPNDSFAQQKTAEIQKLLLEKKTREEQAIAQQKAYDDAIKKADQLLIAQNYTESLAKYREAAELKTTETYPQKKIKEIETILNQLAKDKDRKEKEYQAVIIQADKLFGENNFANAKTEYQKALAIKSEEAYPKEQIGKIDNAIAENNRLEAEKQRLLKEKTDSEYNLAMANADKAFNANDFSTARAGYETALAVKPNDAKAKEKLGQTDAQLAQLAKMTQAYNTAINEANKLLTDKRYTQARDKYQESLQYKPESEYPKEQIAKINELLTRQEAEAKTRQEYILAFAEAETHFKNRDLPKAKEAFMKAYNLIPTETVPPKRISEINTLLAEQEQKESALKATMQAYQEVVARADQHFSSKEYSAAQQAYNEALLTKSDEKYPADQLALIDKLLKEQTEQQYKTAISIGDKAFNSNQLDQATTAYQEALTYKKEDKYAIVKLKEIDQKKAAVEAENNRLKNLQEQYTALIDEANTFFGNAEYSKSKDKYQRALALKPAEVLPKEQIAKIDQLLNEVKKEAETNRQYIQHVKLALDAYNQNNLKVARDEYLKASVLKPSEPMPPTKIAEIDKKIAQLDEAEKLAAMEQAQKMAKEKADKELYAKAIAAGDKAFKEKEYKGARTQYISALTALPNEKYPKSQIAKIDEIEVQLGLDQIAIKQRAEEDSIRTVKYRAYEQAMAMAKDLKQKKEYQLAIAKYGEAILNNPSEKAAIQKLIDDIEDQIQLLARQDAEYKRVIKIADDLFAKSNMEQALAQYRTAATIKSDEEYPKNQIKEIQSVIAAQADNYNNAIKKANAAFEASDWINAKTGYTEALAILPNEVFPNKRLKEVNQKIAEANTAELNKPALNNAYSEAIEKAEKAAKEGQLATAKMQFEVAKSLKPEEKVPAERIKEIDALLDQRDKDRLAQSQQEIDEKYRQAISVADNSFREKTYSIAKLQYKQALVIKPEESYPKNQMALIDKLMNEAQPIETYTSNLPETETVKTTSKPIFNPAESAQDTEARAKNYTTTNTYEEAIKKADDSFGIKDYSVARFYYLKANELKPTDEYPKNQIELIRKLIDSQLSANDVSGYENAIAQADAAFAKASYNVAKFFYYKALEIKSWEKYPKDRINEILALTHSLLSEKEEKEYRDMIAKADEAYFNKDIAIARFYYNRAISIKRDENYPKIKLRDIQQVIDQENQDQQNIEYNRLIELADQALQLENYSIARFNYNKALNLRQDEKYPKDQLKRIKEALEKPKN